MATGFYINMKYHSLLQSFFARPKYFGTYYIIKLLSMALIFNVVTKCFFSSCQLSMIFTKQNFLSWTSENIIFLLINNLGTFLWEIYSNSYDLTTYNHGHFICKVVDVK